MRKMDAAGVASSYSAALRICNVVDWLCGIRYAGAMPSVGAGQCGRHTGRERAPF